MFFPIYLSLPQALQILCHQPPSQVPAAYFWKASHPLRSPCVLKLPSCVTLWEPWGRSCPATLTSRLRSEQLSGTHRGGAWELLWDGVGDCTGCAHRSQQKTPGPEAGAELALPWHFQSAEPRFLFLPSLLQFLLLA